MPKQIFSPSVLAPFALWTALVGGSLFSTIKEANQTASAIARNEGRDVFRVVQAMRLWNAQHGGILVEQDARTPPNPYLELKERDPVTVSGRKLTTLNPAYMTRQVAEVIRHNADLAIHITSLKPINPANAADPWETAALQAFEAGQAKEISEFTSQDGTAQARYMAPLLTKQECLQCHAKQGYQIGDIRGGISVSFSAEPLLATVNQHIKSSATAHGAVWLLVSAVLAGFAAYRQHQAKQREESNRILAEDAKMAALGSMVAGVSHEVNTPLGVCVTAASLVEEAQRQIAAQLADGSLSEEGLRAELERIGQAASILEQNLQRAAKLIRSFKQIAVDQNTTEAREIHLADFLDEIVTAHHNLLKKAKVKTRIECPEKLTVTADAGAFAQIITNLLHNTLMHGAAPGQETQVTISVRDLGSQFEVVYADDGQGMDAETVRRAFDPFFTTKRGQGGSGLGLNIVYNLATQRFKGNVTLESLPGHGAAFTLHLAKD